VALFWIEILVAKKCDPALIFLTLQTLKSKTSEECIIYVVITHIDICDKISYYLVISDTLKTQSVYTYPFCLERNIHTLFVWKGINAKESSRILFLESNNCLLELIVHANKVLESHMSWIVCPGSGRQFGTPRCPGSLPFHSSIAFRCVILQRVCVLMH